MEEGERKGEKITFKNAQGRTQKSTQLDRDIPERERERKRRINEERVRAPD